MGEWNNRKEQSKKRSISFFLIIILIISGLPFIFDIGSENSNVSAAATHYVGGVGAVSRTQIMSGGAPAVVHATTAGSAKVGATATV